MNTEVPTVGELHSRWAMDLLSDKWRIPILHALENGPVRSNALRRRIEGVSPKVLTETLRGMERDGLIERRAGVSGPPQVEYCLSTMGESVIGPLRELCRWAATHLAERDDARRRFDDATSRAAMSREL